MYAKSANELVVYKIAFQSAKEIDGRCRKISFHWTIPEVSQVIRSSSSVAANITEGFGKRFYPKLLIHYLNIALGSSDETQNHLHLLNAKGYIDEDELSYYSGSYKNLSVRILNWINYLKKRHNILLG